MGQAPHHYPHLHCIVPGGGIAPDQTRWVACPPGFFLPVRVLSRRFRDLFVRALRGASAGGQLRFPGALAALADPAAFAAQLDQLCRIDWVVYAKPPFAGPEQVLGLPRPLHPSRRAGQLPPGGPRRRPGQLHLEGVRQGGTTKVMTLAADEFIRRFLQHTVPDGLPPHPPHRLPRQPPSHQEAGPLPRAARRVAARAESTASLAGSPARPQRPGRRGLPVLRWPDADRRPDPAAAAATGHVVRQLMMPLHSTPIRAVPSGNADIGGGRRVLHTAPRRSWASSRRAPINVRLPAIGCRPLKDPSCGP